MDILNIVLLLIPVVIIGAGVGYLISYYTREELVVGRKYFRVMSILGVVLGIFFIFNNAPIGLTLIFLAVISAVSLYKSKDKKFVKRRI